MITSIEPDRQHVHELRLVEGRTDSGVIAVVVARDGYGVLWYNSRLVSQGSTLWYVRLWARHAIAANRRFDALGTHQFREWPPF